MGYNSSTLAPGRPTSRSGRPGPNFGLITVVDFPVTSYTAAIINSVVVTGGSLVITILRSHSIKFDSLTTTNGASVGSAVTIVLRVHAGAGSVVSTGSSGGAPAAPLAIPADCTRTDDFAGVTLAYSARGTRGIPVAGSPSAGFGTHFRHN